MREEIPHKSANIASAIPYSEAHQKLGHPGEKITKQQQINWGGNQHKKQRNV
jgi:hypothetical protein